MDIRIEYYDVDKQLQVLELESCDHLEENVVDILKEKGAERIKKMFAGDYEYVIGFRSYDLEETIKDLYMFVEIVEREDEISYFEEKLAVIDYEGITIDIDELNTVLEDIYIYDDPFEEYLMEQIECYTHGPESKFIMDIVTDLYCYLNERQKSQFFKEMLDLEFFDASEYNNLYHFYYDINCL